MMFHHQQLTETENVFLLPYHVHAMSHPCLNKTVFKEFWHNFTVKNTTLSISETSEYVFSVGTAPKLPLDSNDYSIHVTPGGFCVCADNAQNLIYGFLTLLARLKVAERNGETVIEVKCCQIRERASIRNRMVHFCVFPETELWELQRFVRFCSALKYTHLVLEFWGTLKYDCLKELSWPNAFTKEQIKPIIDEAHDLGLEIVPMFNHWGHASAGRVMHGKHVVLDQNPSLQTYFSEDGWCWDISKPKVMDLLRKIRAELTELCGAGSYFHIGCDEAYNFEFTDDNLKILSDFINEISEEMNVLGRRVFVWGDMFLYHYNHYNPQNEYTCNAPTPDVEQYFLNSLNKNIIIADWQYCAKEAPVETCSVFRRAGFDCILCPWDRGIAELEACVATVKSESLTGIMHTTWHTLSSGTPFVLLAAVESFEAERSLSITNASTCSAALMRKVMPANGNYERAGWSRHQVGFQW